MVHHDDSAPRRGPGRATDGAGAGRRPRHVGIWFANSGSSTICSHRGFVPAARPISRKLSRFSHRMSPRIRGLKARPGSWKTIWTARRSWRRASLQAGDVPPVGGVPAYGVIESIRARVDLLQAARLPLDDAEGFCPGQWSKGDGVASGQFPANRCGKVFTKMFALEQGGHWDPSLLAKVGHGGQKVGVGRGGKTGTKNPVSTMRPVLHADAR